MKYEEEDKTLPPPMTTTGDGDFRGKMGMGNQEAECPQQGTGEKEVGRKQGCLLIIVGSSILVTS